MENKQNLLSTLKESISDAPFKTAFKVTLGFYAAQLLISVIGLSVFAGLVVLGVYLAK